MPLDNSIGFHTNAAEFLFQPEVVKDRQDQDLKLKQKTPLPLRPQRTYKRYNRDNRTPLFHDPTLPPGWSRYFSCVSKFPLLGCLFFVSHMDLALMKILQEGDAEDDGGDCRGVGHLPDRPNWEEVPLKTRDSAPLREDRRGLHAVGGLRLQPFWLQRTGVSKCTNSSQEGPYMYYQVIEEDQNIPYWEEHGEIDPSQFLDDNFHCPQVISR